ncbi:MULTISPECIES: right-handed parallel beta-helix repeat-containing protein [Mesorhizobium]|uniref:Right handed beta helix domain-containing protein n=1 Tax=Mesorhizobium denitrificans TaxID=2294114 RepID=A0A371X230_9HYPH|nr:MULTISPECIES: right-handed parallel beta-helix repeat-containing protein [Mesorhizobium]RFC63267.1 hypothetical protein DY251_20845 [Mesorhizobium denitrificans]
MGWNLIQVLRNAGDSELAIKVAEALAADEAENLNAIQEKNDVIASLQKQIATITAEAEDLKKLNVTNYDLQKQLQVKTAENEILRQYIAQLNAGNVKSEPKTGFVWPNASNTGIPAGAVLTAYDGPSIISEDGTVIEDKLITTDIEVTGRNVTFRRCKFTNNSQWLLNGDTAKDLTVEDCEFANGVKAILGQGTFTRLNIWNCIIGITLKDGKSTVKGCYIHDLSAHAQPKDPHFDGIFIAGGQTDCLIEDNLIEMPSSGGTAAIFIGTRWQGANIVNTKVSHNRLLGTPSYAMYNEQTSVAEISGTQWIGNEIQRGAYGYWTWQSSTPVRSGNVDALTGADIDGS